MSDLIHTPYSGKDYEFLFNDPAGTLKDSAFEALRHKNVFRYRAKTIKSGNVVEIEIYPIWNTQNETRSAKARTTRQAQEKVNDRNSKKALTRIIDNNFGKDDHHITLTYRWDELPDEAQALRDMQGFIKRVRYYHKKNGLLDAKGRPDLKYVYVIEFADGDGRRKRIHHHVIMNGRAPRKDVKSLWPHGRASVDELEPENGTLEGLARYIIKQPNQTKQTKRWQASRNLKPPKVTVSDTKLSKKQAERLAADVKAAAPQIFSKLFRDYNLDVCTVKTSEFVAGAYIYAKMHKEQAEKRKGVGG